VSDISAEEAAFLDICESLERQLLSGISRPITEASSLPRKPGVYMLLLDGQHVYSGKAVTKQGLQQRASIHLKKLTAAKIEGRVDIKVVATMATLATGFEQHLIQKYPTAWNGSGFGSNAHGTGRPKQRTSVWNKQYIVKEPV
jgi:hypothetical protein